VDRIPSSEARVSARHVEKCLFVSEERGCKRKTDPRARKIRGRAWVCRMHVEVVSIYNQYPSIEDQVVHTR
jgi:hypothetical protein